MICGVKEWFFGPAIEESLLLMPEKVTFLRQTHPWLALKKGAKGEGRRCKYAWEDVTLSSALALPRHLLHIQHHHKHQDIFPSGLDIFFTFNILFNINIDIKMSSALALALVWGLQHPTHLLLEYQFLLLLDRFEFKTHQETPTHKYTLMQTLQIILERQNPSQN